MAYIAGKALMELRVAMCQKSAGSAGVRCARPTLTAPRTPHPAPRSASVLKWVRMRSQRLLGQELRGGEGGEPEAAHPAAGEQRHHRQGHRHLRCALCTLFSPQCGGSHPTASTRLRGCDGAPGARARGRGGSRGPHARLWRPSAEFGVEKSVDAEGFTADAFGGELASLMKGK